MTSPAEIKVFDATNVLDSTYNIANCSSTAAYMTLPNSVDGMACICQLGYGAQDCSRHEPSALLIRLIGTQIFMGIFLLALLVISVAYFLASLRDHIQYKRKALLRIIATSLFIVALILKVVWMIDAFEENILIRIVPRTAGIFCYWVSAGFYLAAGAVVLGYWYVLLFYLNPSPNTAIQAQIVDFQIDCA